MPVYLVTYDLRQPGRNYQGLYDAINSLGNSVCKLMDSTLLIYCDVDAADLYNHLINFIDRTDTIFVAQIARNYATWNIPPGAKEWLDGSFTLP